MYVKVSDYVAQFLVDNGISQVFTVAGGSAMHLNDSLGHKEGITCIYNHHEQAGAMAAESYARISDNMAVVCVTSGPGGTNAITGVAGAYVDSIPMLVLSGQVRCNTSVRSTDLDLRALGDQEIDIVRMVEGITKYCQVVDKPEKIRFCLEKAIYIAYEGRPGPCWLDIPVDVQGMYVETDMLEGYQNGSNQGFEFHQELSVSNNISKVLEYVNNAKRPVIYAGNGIRIAGAHKEFMTLVDMLKIPVVTAWNSIDLIPTDNPLYVGRGGIMGDRAGNFAVQNADLVLSIGCRLSIRQVGYNWKTWAREARVIMVDADINELRKPTLHVDVPILADAKEFITYVYEELKKSSMSESASNTAAKDQWRNKCLNWKAKYPVVTEKHYQEKGLVNVYAFVDELSRRLPATQVTVVGNGSASVVGSQAFYVKENTRFIINSGMASMGYDLPAAIGAYMAKSKDKSYDNGIVLITGDGSIQMNLQELQTIVHNRIPAKIFLINNQGYHSIRQTQDNLFMGNFVGVGPDSEDLSFPSFEGLAKTYGFKYYSCCSNSQMTEIIDTVLKEKIPVLCEIYVTKDQKFEPKAATKKLPDGTLVSPPLEDMAPFLDREELCANMVISPISGSDIT